MELISNPNDTNCECQTSAVDSINACQGFFVYNLTGGSYRVCPLAERGTHGELNVAEGGHCTSAKH